MNSGSMRLACDPTLSTRHTFVSSCSVSMQYELPSEPVPAYVGGKNGSPAPSTGTRCSLITKADGPPLTHASASSDSPMSKRRLTGHIKGFVGAAPPCPELELPAG